MVDVQIKSSSQTGMVRATFIINLEIGPGGGAMGTLVTIHTGVNFDPAHTPLSKIQAEAASRALPIFQAVAATSPENLTDLLMRSLQKME